VKIGQWKATQGLNERYNQIRELGLESNVAELDAFGFTVVENAIDQATVDTLLRRICDVAGNRLGTKVDPIDGSTHAGTTQMLNGMLLEGPEFERALLHPVAQTLLAYLLGDSYLLDSLHAFVKGPGAPALPLHDDTAQVPEPMARYAQVANCNWLLTDYAEHGAGAIRFVPGSHRFCRHPRPDEMNDESRMVTVEAPPGSFVVFHGNTWHGAEPKTSDGLRVNLIYYGCRTYMRPQEFYFDKLPAEVFERNPPEFARLLGRDLPFTDNSYDVEKTKLLGSVSRAQHL
jgi:ectoine hydroxylase-related dioxygenase (phytanoyl-CoA dioxygenase family)